MTTSTYDDPTLAALSPRDIASWLRMRGFEHKAQYGEFGALFVREQEGTTHEVILPTSPTVRDFARRMEELVTDLSESEQRPPADILTDLTLAPFDVVKVRSPDADDYGSVKLAAGLDLHQEARNLLLAAANAAASLVPRKSWRGRRFDEVSAYLENVRLGQSQRGSFVLTILSPWDFTVEAAPALDLGQRTFGRRVTLSLASALRATEVGIRQAVAGGLGPLINSYTEGVSANLCSALAKLAREGDGIDVSINWGAAQPESEKVTIRLQREDAAILTEAAKELARQEPEPDVLLEGLVAAISEEPERFDGSAVLETVIGNGVRRVRVQFGVSERRLIYDAAKEKKWIRVVGDLRREGQRLALINPRDIAVVVVANDAEESDVST